VYYRAQKPGFLAKVCFLAEKAKAGKGRNNSALCPPFLL
jgi:hypothetical protein